MCKAVCGRVLHICAERMPSLVQRSTLRQTQARFHKFPRTWLPLVRHRIGTMPFSIKSQPLLRHSRSCACLGSVWRPVCRQATPACLAAALRRSVLSTVCQLRPCSLSAMGRLPVPCHCPQGLPTSGSDAAPRLLCTVMAATSESASTEHNLICGSTPAPARTHTSSSNCARRQRATQLPRAAQVPRNADLGSAQRRSRPQSHALPCHRGIPLFPRRRNPRAHRSRRGVLGGRCLQPGDHPLNAARVARRPRARPPR